MKEKILDYMLRINPDLDLNKAEFYVECNIDEVLNYCNISELPLQLQRLIAKYSLDTLEITAGVESITEGDTTIKYTTETSSGITTALKSQINRFRKVGTL